MVKMMKHAPTLLDSVLNGTADFQVIENRIALGAGNQPETPLPSTQISTPAVDDLQEVAAVPVPAMEGDPLTADNLNRAVAGIMRHFPTVNQGEGSELDTIAGLIEAGDLVTAGRRLARLYAVIDPGYKTGGRF